MMSNPPSYRLYSALFLVSVSIIAYQLLLIQTLAIVQWYHFAYMIISIALLGFGASGTILSLFRKTILSNEIHLSPLFLWFSGISMIIALRFSQSSNLAFDSYLVFHDWSHITRLILTYLLFFIPFFSGALFIGLTFRIHADNIGKLYFSNLTGSAFGGLIIIFLLDLLSVQQTIALIAIFPLLAALLILKSRKIKLAQTKVYVTHSQTKVYVTHSQTEVYVTHPQTEAYVTHPQTEAYVTHPQTEVYVTRSKTLWIIVLTASLLFSLFNVIKPPGLFLSQYKSLSKTLLLPETEIIAEQSTPYGLLQGVKSPYLRYAPGLSFNYQGEIPFEIMIFNNGDFVGPLFPTRLDESEHYYDYSTLALPFLLGEKERVLILDSGSGDLVSYAAHRDIVEIIAVEGNRALLNFLENDLSLGGYNSSYDDQRVRTIAQDSYSFLLTDNNLYDLITLPLTDAFGGSAGIYAMREKYLLTQNSFQLMWEKLSDRGMITISTWIDYPIRYPLKALATMVELLNSNNIEQPVEHITAIRNWSMITFVVSKTPLSDEDIYVVRKFSAENGFDILLLPGLQDEERSRFNILADDSLFDLTDRILGSERVVLYRNYPFNIRPATINRPYFFQFLKISRISELLEDFELRNLPFLELGYLLVLITFIQIIILTAIFIFLPLLVKRWKTSGKLWTFLYFALIGTGFMMLEIVLIQRFIFYLETPLYSTAVVISAILLFSGIGSYFSSYLSCRANHFIKILLVIFTLVIIYTLFLNPLLHKTLHFSLSLRVLLTIIYLAPLSLSLGFPFPLGIRLLTTTQKPDNISWAWAINGSFSVISTVLATIIAVEAGFSLVMLIAAGCYLLALVGHILIKN